MRRRKALLAKVHIAKKEMGLDDDTYRGVLHHLFEVDSSKYLTNQQLIELVKHFEERGWKPRRRDNSKRPKKAWKPEEETAQDRKVMAILNDLKFEEAYANRIALKMFKVHSWRWLKPGQKGGLIGALEKQRARQKQKGGEAS